MTRIAFLGLGAMGRRMAARLIAAGHGVTVWNRRQMVEPLAGAKVAESPPAAALGAEIVVSMVRDDAASASVWLDERTGALAGMAPGSVGSEVSTISPSQARLLHAAAGQRGLRFVDAPVAGARPQAEAGQLIFMAGGEAEVVKRLTPVLMGWARRCTWPAALVTGCGQADRERDVGGPAGGDGRASGAGRGGAGRSGQGGWRS